MSFLLLLVLVGATCFYGSFFADGSRSNRSTYFYDDDHCHSLFTDDDCRDCDDGDCGD